MKNSILFLFALILISCTSDDNKVLIENEALLGKWKVIEVLVDPGDGSGTFQPATYNRTVEFFSNAIVTASGTLCFLGSESNPSTGTFKLISTNETDINHDGEIKPNDCGFSEARVYFDITSNNELILWYPCIEGCGEKFEKI
ncbi:hypothetical protein [Jejuia spongiicola]|uniref:Lipocalin-like domain-containing protein n=1 Tax=Jejuia spongiicola TaxID=2942207 RepID=A0ABT0QC71_9FLAO|nr:MULTISPECIES: hypothetical protein [Flavobacteriaceae]MCL6294566.1 hypothetical protein [Jejuia spongiicola]PIA78113.1 hypothetical protein BFR04_07730 [Gaetbulibacter sp. 4G1]